MKLLSKIKNFISNIKNSVINKTMPNIFRSKLINFATKYKIIKNKKFLYILAALFITLAAAFFISLLMPEKEQETVYIALAGNMNEGYQRGEEMQNAVQMYFDNVNQAGGIDGRILGLRIVNDKNDRKTAMLEASKIAESKDILLVLGHAWSNTALSAGNIYKKKGVPAITASATTPLVTQDNHWYFRVATNNEFKTKYLVNYICNTLKKKHLSIIFDTQYYGDMFPIFRNQSRRAGISIRYQGKYTIGEENINLSDQFARITAELRTTNNPGLIFIAGFGPSAAELITYLKQGGEKYSIIILDPFLSDDLDFFKKFDQEKLNPGYFLDGVYTVSPIIMDLGDQKVRDFVKEYRKKYDKAPGWYAAFYYDAAAVAVEAFKRAEIKNQEKYIRTDRREIKKALESMYNSEMGVQGFTGPVYFDQNGDSNNPLSIGFYKKQRLLPAYSQYVFKQDISNINEEDYPIDKLMSGDMLLIENKLMSAQKVVYTGIDINQISNIDIKKLRYTADFYLWFRYHGDFNDSDIIFTNAAEPIKLGKPISEKKEGLVTIRTYRLKSEFKIDADFHDYPFDKQILDIKFNHSQLKREELIYKTDDFGMGLDKKDTDLFLKSIIVPGENWDAKGRYFNENIITTASSLGIPEYFDPTQVKTYSEFCVSVPVVKSHGDSILRGFFPVIALLMILYLMYALEGKKLFLGNIIIIASVILATVFYHIKLLLDFNVEYIMALEYSYFTIYLLAVINFIIMIMINKQKQANTQEKIKKLKYTGLAVNPLMWSVVGFFYFFKYML